MVLQILFKENSLSIFVKFILLCCVLISTCLPAFSNTQKLPIDTVRMNTGAQDNDLRARYRGLVLKKALDATIDEFGPYEIKIIELPTTVSRALIEVESGQTINLFIGVTTKEWEARTNVIRIPIRRGIVSYRLLAVHKDNVKKFENVQTLDDLKSLSAGLRVGWATTKVLAKQNFQYFELRALGGLYNMLNNNAIDYIPRGINEIYDEIDARQPNDIVVEPNIALLLQSPTYIMVSPSETRLATRIETGLEKMVKEGSLKRIFDDFFAENLAKANIASRRILVIDNPEQPNTIPFDREELWFFNDQ